MIARQFIERACPPAWIAQVEARMLTKACQKAALQTGMQPPAISGANALERFKNMTLALAEVAEQRDVLKRALGKEAEKLGRLARRVTCASDADAFILLRFLYQGIGIEITGNLPGELRFRRCYFSQFYTPQTCDLMSAMDEGVMRGLAGKGTLAFSARITEGCPCCEAHFSERNAHE